MSTIYPTNGTTYSTSTGTSLGSFTTTSGMIYTTPTFTTFTTTTDTNWQSSTGCSTILRQDYSAFASQWQTPDHFFNPDDSLYGGCIDCAQANVHRMDPSSHPPVINEEPDADDWWQLLAS